MKLATSLRDLVEGAESLVYVEDISSKRGFLQSINPAAKLSATLLMIVTSLFVTSLSYLALMCTIPLVLALASKVPMKNFLMRIALVPFFAAIISLPVLFITPGSPILQTGLGSFNLAVTIEGLQRFSLFTVRVWFCVASLLVFILSTGFSAFLKLLPSIRVPSILIQMFSLTYRYLFVSIHEIQRVLIGRESRTYINRHTITLKALKHSGAVLATIFIRTYERSERVYLAMKSRGFDINNSPQTPVSPFHAKDLLFLASAIVMFGLLLAL